MEYLQAGVQGWLMSVMLLLGKYVKLPDTELVWLES